ncbi:hypothetical protein AYX13_07071, partial [Cryptococcus neoformans]
IEVRVERLRLHAQFVQYDCQSAHVDRPDRSSGIQAHPLVGGKGARDKQHGKGGQFRDRGDSGGYRVDGCDEESQHRRIFAKHWERPLEVRDGIRYETPDTPSVKAWP